MSAFLSSHLGIDQVNAPPTHLRGILQTKDYHHFMILSDTGNLLHEFIGAKQANKCLPGDHVGWVTHSVGNEKCELELRDQHPLLVGTLELTSKSTYGMTRRGHLMYLCTPYDKRYPPFIVGSSEKDRSQNLIVLIKLEEWATQFPRGSIQQTLGRSGEEKAEYQALIWQACPWKYPVYAYQPKLLPSVSRIRLSGTTFHIDPEGCRDVDDVITMEPIHGSNNWLITITISDVAAFVEEGSAVDIMASLIGQTLYDTDGRVLRPMLPPEYSEQACSLLPGKERYGISLQFIWDTIMIRDPTWFQSVLMVNQSYSYEEFQVSDSPFRPVLQTIASYLAKKPVTDSHEWIEQMMILYNTEAGKQLKAMKQGIVRRHSPPDRERLQAYREHVPELEMLAFSSAEYCLAEEEDTVHSGLDSDHYAHASSPIRRYADLVNQRVLTNWIQGSTDYYIVPQAMYDMNLRGKAIKNFARDVTFLRAISTGPCPVENGAAYGVLRTTGQTSFEGIIMEKIPIEEGFMKIKIYVPQWKRMVSTTYRMIKDQDHVLSRDEKTEIDVTLYRRVSVQCAFVLQNRNWKERVILNIC
jgi:exoribonuclease R